MRTVRFFDEGWALAPVGVALLVGAPLVLSVFAYHDDWPFLDASFEPGFAAPQLHSIADGRPLFALLTELSWLPVAAVEHLGALRLLSLAGVVALALAVGRWLRRLAVPPSVAWPAAAGVVVLAPLPLFSAWAITWPFGWTAAVAFVAGARVRERVATGFPTGRGWREALPEILVLVAAVLVYPPSALVGLVPAVIAPLLVESGRSEVGPWAPFVRVALLFGAATATAIALWQLSLRWVSLDSGHLSRVRVVGIDELAAKLRWVVRHPVPRAFDLVNSSTHVAIALAIGAVIAVGLALAIRRSGLPVLRSVATIVIGLAATFTAVWLPAGQYFAYRTIVAPMLAAHLLLVVAIRELASRVVSGRLAVGVTSGLLCLLACGSMIQVLFAYSLPLIDIHQRELAAIRSAAAQIVAGAPERVEFRQIDWRRARRPGRFSEWNAFPSSADRWYAEPMLRVATRELGEPFAGEFELVAPEVELPPVAAGRTLRIDYRDEFANPPGWITTLRGSGSSTARRP